MVVPQVLILPLQPGVVKVLGILPVALAALVVEVVRHQAMKLVGLVILHQRVHRREMMVVMPHMRAVTVLVVAVVVQLPQVLTEMVEQVPEVLVVMVQ